MLNGNDKEISLTFAKGLSVLLAFDAKDRSITISEIAEKVNLNRAVVRRLVRTLEQLGYLNVDRGRYELTPHVLNLSQGFIEGRGITQMIQPILRKAAEEIGEAISFAMLDHVDAVYVAHAFLPAGFTLNRVAVGTRLPLPQTAAGRAMLAYLDEARRERILAGSEFADFIQKTGMDRARFDDILRETHERGFAESEGDYVSDVASLAAPVFTPGMGEVIGAVSIIFERARYSAEDRANIIPHLKACAKHVSSTL
ncbi:Pca operon regulatory protein [Thalassovita gelatinovora]|uniref:Pca operon regulatory protein n=1 Tax=Thalassovita gelatinovora TaxID=53501 RepID=A0A0P1F6L2_THAGE|nr:IclR family transcriptional regulator [Thalassovita gelatinovora]QIZ79175.1 IclR family transcriptional regulator [Thalassovita gelatinovora]CUH63641.1 Pca operon regulatory protein [Thalassovita gelatinovora]SER00863.1 transcriptional regulator, IclR family [Thalassovita gelatinovora]